MRLRRHPADGFSMSFLDVMACGLGAVVLILILVDFEAFTETPSEEKEKLEQELAAAERQQQQLKAAIQEVNEKIALASATQDEAREEKNETVDQQSELLKDISEQAAVVATLEDQLAAIARTPTPDAQVSLAGTGEQNYITGMKVEGDQIGLLIDKSASMMDDNLIGVLSKLRLSDAQKTSSAKWQRTTRVVRWLVARLPGSSKVTAVAFSEDAEVLGLRPVNSVRAGGSMDAMVADLGRVVPDGGTNLQLGISKLTEANPGLTDIYLVTDGLPTLGDGLPLKCRSFISSSKSISSDCRRALATSTVKRAPSGVRINVILLPIDGDPYASSVYWNWTFATGGRFLSPAPEWP